MADLHAKFAGLPTEPLELDAGTTPVDPPRRERAVRFGHGLRTVRAGICPGCGTTRSLVLVGGHLAIRGHEHDWGHPCTGSARRWCDVPAERRVRSPCECERKAAQALLDGAAREARGRAR